MGPSGAHGQRQATERQKTMVFISRAPQMVATFLEAGNANTGSWRASDGKWVAVPPMKDRWPLRDFRTDKSLGWANWSLDKEQWFLRFSQDNLYLAARVDTATRAARHRGGAELDTYFDTLKVAKDKFAELGRAWRAYFEASFSARLMRSPVEDESFIAPEHLDAMVEPTETLAWKIESECRSLTEQCELAAGLTPGTSVPEVGKKPAPRRARDYYYNI